jgi:hypothetical protein
MRKAWWTGLAAVLVLGCGEGGGAEPGGVPIAERDFVCATGEGTPCETASPARSDEERSRVVAEGESTVEFVIRELELPPIDAGTTPPQAPGFNVDGRDSGGGSFDGACADIQPDYAAARDAEAIGVDNYLSATLLPTLLGILRGATDAMGEPLLDCPPGSDDCLGDIATAQISEGGFVFLLRVTGWNETPNDDAVSVELFLGQNTTEAPTLDAAGFLAPGQSYDVEMPVGTAVPGTVLDGRLSIRTPTLPIRVDFDGEEGQDPVPLTIALGQTEVRMDLMGPDLALNGNIGGTVTLDAFGRELLTLLDALGQSEFLAIAGPFFGLAIDEEGNIVESATPATLQPDIDADGDNTCETISAGIHFSAAGAIINGG